MASIRWTAAIALAACALSTPLAAQEPQAQGYWIPGRGALQLRVPDGWRANSNTTQDPASVYLQLVPASGDAFNLQITSVWLDPAKLANFTPESIKSSVQKTATGMLPRSVEKEVAPVALRGAEAVGYHYSLTDRASPLPAGEYKYLTQGVMRIGELFTTFTFLHHERVIPEREQVLRMLADAKFVKSY